VVDGGGEIPPVPASGDFQLDPRQRQIAERLVRLGAQELADVYQGAVAILSQPTLPGAVRFVAHAVREIIRALPLYVDIPIPQRLDYTERLNELAELFQRAGLMKRVVDSLSTEVPLPDAAASTMQGSMVQLPAPLFIEVQALIRDHSQSVMFTHQSVLEETVVKFDVSHGNGGSAHVRPVVRQLRSIHAWAVKCAHLPGPGHAPPSRGECGARFRAFEDVLFALWTPFYEPVKELDDILGTANA
jgi:hypothetical protein